MTRSPTLADARRWSTRRGARRAVDAHAAIDNDEEPTGHSPTDAEYTVAFSPRQLAGGFAIIAALIILIARRRRKKS